jgi:hypothetical protein
LAEASLYIGAADRSSDFADGIADGGQPAFKSSPTAEAEIEEVAAWDTVPRGIPGGVGYDSASGEAQDCGYL